MDAHTIVDRLVNALLMVREELEFGGDWQTAKGIATEAIEQGQTWLRGEQALSPERRTT